MAHVGQLDKPLRQALFVISPMAGNAAHIPASHAKLTRRADAHPDLTLLVDTGRLRIYASRDLVQTHPELAEQITAQQ